MACPKLLFRPKIIGQFVALRRHRFLRALGLGASIWRRRCLDTNLHQFDEALPELGRKNLKDSVSLLVCIHIRPPTIPYSPHRKPRDDLWQTNPPVRWL